MKVRVLEVDQWTSTGNIEGNKLIDWETNLIQMLNAVKGANVEAIRKIFGGYAYVKEVSEHHRPPLGYVWFKPDEAGLLHLWKTNYDSSD